MSVYLFESDENDFIGGTEGQAPVQERGSQGSVVEDFDELMLASQHFEPPQSHGNSSHRQSFHFETNPANDNNDDNEDFRCINFILDHSAFVRGIGNIKRWFSEEYVRTSYQHICNDKIKLVIHIPTYTLHEFDFVKKGNTMMATNAREALKFIDKLVNDDDSTTRDIGGIKFQCCIDIEMDQGFGHSNGGISWNECLRYKVYSPAVKEFPNYKTKFDSNLLGKSSLLANDDTQKLKLNDIQYENSESYQNALAHGDSPASMPDRLKYLIRSCIKKQRATNQQWRLVTEDPITKIWAISFGIECFNINEAELFMFQDYDINYEKQKIDPHYQYSDGKVTEGPNSILQNTIDSSVYDYVSTRSSSKPDSSKKDHKNSAKQGQKQGQKQNQKGPKAPKAPKGQKQPPKNQQSKNKPIEGIVNETTGANGSIVKKERFDAINFAPRGQGLLWTP